MKRRNFFTRLLAGIGVTAIAPSLATSKTSTAPSLDIPEEFDPKPWEANAKSFNGIIAFGVGPWEVRLIASDEFSLQYAWEIMVWRFGVRYPMKIKFVTGEYAHALGEDKDLQLSFVNNLREEHERTMDRINKLSQRPNPPV